MPATNTLRIFLVLAASANSAVKQNQTWLRNLHAPLVDLGHEVFLFQAENGVRAMAQKNAALRTNFSEHLVRTFREEHAKKPFDLIFTYLMDGMVLPDAIDQMRVSGVPAVNFSCNNIHQFDLVQKISPHYDLNLHSEKHARESFIQIGAKPLWWPMASNPNFFKPKPLARDIQISFVGGNYGLRARTAGQLLDNGIDVHLYGSNWRNAARTPWRGRMKRALFLARAAMAADPGERARWSGELADHDYRAKLWSHYPQNLHGAASDDDMIALYSRSHISLGFLEVYDQHDPSRAVLRHLHLREFEAPMSGALYCTGFTDELAEMFVPDREILIYRNSEELLDKARYYLSNPAQGEEIRAAGHRRALHDHTYHKRFRDLFSEMRLI